MSFSFILSMISFVVFSQNCQTHPKQLPHLNPRRSQAGNLPSLDLKAYLMISRQNILKTVIHCAIWRENVFLWRIYLGKWKSVWVEKETFQVCHIQTSPQTILQDNIQLSNQNTRSPYQLYTELYPIMGLCKGEEEDIIGFFCSTQMLWVINKKLWQFDLASLSLPLSLAHSLSFVTLLSTWKRTV